MCLRRKLVYIFGIHHALQDPLTHECCVPQKEEYGKELNRLADKYGFDVYCEEADHSVFSAAERCSIDRRKRYVNIDLPRDMRKKCRIPLDYTQPAKVTQYGQTQIDKWNRFREDYMFERVNERLGSESVALVLCGFEHMTGLKNRFKDLGGSVESASVEEMKWHDAKVFTKEHQLELELRPTRS